MPEGKRFDGSVVPDVTLGPCDWPDCTAVARSEECNAEGDEGRMHWHGRVHVGLALGSERAAIGLMRLCPEHAEFVRAYWRSRWTTPTTEASGR